MSTFNCPKCGATLKVIPLSGDGGGWERGRAFASGAPPPGAEYSREIPAANVSGIEAGVKTPALQALLTGLAVGAVTVILTIWRDWAWPTPIVAAVIAAALAWWLLLLNTRGLLKSVERIVGRDLDGDGQVGFVVEITEKLPERQRVQYAHFPAARPEVERFATAALNGWLTVNSPHRLSRRKFTQLRDVALDRGLLCWRCDDAHQQGCETTAVGRFVFKKLVIGDV